MQLDEDRPATARTLLVGGEADLAGKRLAGSGRTVQDPLGRAVARLHQDPGGPLLATVVILPGVDRAAADRGLVEGHLEQFEPAMSANHDHTVSGLCSLPTEPAYRAAPARRRASASMIGGIDALIWPGTSCAPLMSMLPSATLRAMPAGTGTWVSSLKVPPPSLTQR
jgi:hypothetical protein